MLWYYPFHCSGVCKLTILFYVVCTALPNANGDVKTLRDVQMAASLQDQAQLTLNKYIASAYPTQPFRFGKLLLMLPSLKTICSNTIEELFFRKTIGSIPIERLLVDMFKSTDF